MKHLPRLSLGALSIAALFLLPGGAMLASCQSNIVAIGYTGGSGDSVDVATTGGTFSTSAFTGVVTVGATSAAGTKPNAAGSGEFGVYCSGSEPNGIATVSSVASTGTTSQCNIVHTDTDGNVFHAVCDAGACDCLVNGEAVCQQCDNTSFPDCSAAICCPKAWGPNP